MSVKKEIEKYLKESNITIPVDSFVHEVSNIYHKFESTTYDNQHKGIVESAKVLIEALNGLFSELPSELVVLDFGCGTGYATLQLLNSKLVSKIKKIVCFDLSPEMVAVAKSKLEQKQIESDIEFEYFSDIEGLNNIKELKFDLVITNAVLHHILDLQTLFDMLERLIKSNGTLIIGHEPNSRFYNNQELIDITRSFQKYKRRKRLFSVSFWKRRFNKKAQEKSLPELTNEELLRKELIKTSLPLSIIPKLVDIHVPIGLSKDQVWGEIGFNGNMIINKFLPNFNLIFETSYSHIKDNKIYESTYWKRLNNKLADKYPLDGADCIMMFKKN